MSEQMIRITEVSEITKGVKWGDITRITYDKQQHLRKEQLLPEPERSWMWSIFSKEELRDTAVINNQWASQSTGETDGYTN